MLSHTWLFRRCLGLLRLRSLASCLPANPWPRKRVQKEMKRTSQRDHVNEVSRVDLRHPAGLQRSTLLEGRLQQEPTDQREDDVRHAVRPEVVVGEQIAQGPRVALVASRRAERTPGGAPASKATRPACQRVGQGSLRSCRTCRDDHTGAG